MAFVDFCGIGRDTCRIFLPLLRVDGPQSCCLDVVVGICSLGTAGCGALILLWPVSSTVLSPRHFPWPSDLLELGRFEDWIAQDVQELYGRASAIGTG